jgi:hypothetical protein
LPLDFVTLSAVLDRLLGGIPRPPRYTQRPEPLAGNLEVLPLRLPASLFKRVEDVHPPPQSWRCRAPDAPDPCEPESRARRCRCWTPTSSLSDRVRVVPDEARSQ